MNTTARIAVANKHKNFSFSKVPEWKNLKHDIQRVKVKNE